MSSNPKSNKPIGIFDSGAGGLTVAKEIIKELPSESLIYFGDVLRIPYGERTSEELAVLSRKIIDFLLTHDIKALVVACGTISSRIFHTVSGFVPQDMPVLEIVNPVIQGTLGVRRDDSLFGPSANTAALKIGLIATEGTINSGTFQNAILKARPEAEVMAVNCPLFVHLAEEGWFGGEVTDLTAQIYLEPFIQFNPQALILGCTHYPLLSDSISKVLPSTKLINPAEYLALDLKQKLKSLNLLSDDRNPKHKFYVTAKKEKFDKLAATILGISCDSVITKLS
jgi:glutamate racemase